MMIHRTDVAVIAVFAAVAYTISYYKQRCRCAPHLAKLAPLPPAPGVVAILAAAFYASNIGYNVRQKRVLLVYPYPLLLTTLDFGVCSLCCVVAWASGLQRRPSRSSLALGLQLAPVAVLHWMGVLLTNVSMLKVNLALTHTVKAAEPLFIEALLLAFYGNRPPPKAAAGCVMIAAGVGLATKTDVSFAWDGFRAAMGSNLCVALRNMLMKRRIKEGDSEFLNSYALLQCGAFLISLPFALWFEGDHLQGLASLPQASMIPLIGALFWVSNMASVTFLSQFSPVTHSVIRSLRRPVLILSSVMAFDTPVSPLNCVGVLSALLGAWLCTSA